VNIVKRHQRPRRGTMQGGIIDKDMPMHVSSVAIVCSHCGPTRVGSRRDEHGQKVRICRKCGGEL
ncbi:MAG: 50S ribosomal protein L24, partial [Acidimicrobiales bacterium]